jgi:hypothetical protein
MTQEAYEMDLTPAQRDALLAIYARRELKETWGQFIGAAWKDFSGCIMVPWCGMVLGIEEDGYTHS